ncbi:MAG: CidA/LrgA family protein [Alphaproteobacteria bacterium]|nr:CidA/LrgA family protein [Alphaproteobacteria bacterium]
MLGGVFIILLLQLVGEAVQKYFDLTIPGPVIGLLLLLGLLLILRRLPRRPRALDAMRDDVIATSGHLLNHLSLLFVPIGVGVILHLPLLEDQLLAVFAVIILGTIATLVVTGVIFARLISRRDLNGGADD